MSSTDLIVLEPCETAGLPSACTEVTLKAAFGFSVTRPPLGAPPSKLNLGASVAPFDSVIVPRLTLPMVEVSLPLAGLKVRVWGVALLIVAVVLLPLASTTEPIDAW